MSELDKTIEELEQEVLDDLNEAEMKKDSSAPTKGAAAADPMKKMDAEEDKEDDLGDKPEVAAKSIKKDGSIPVKTKGDEKPMKMKEDSDG